MKLALIPPICGLAHTLQTDYQLMLPHMLENRTYYDMYRALCKDARQFVIFDNGAAEDQLTGNFALLTTALYVHPDELVIPDIIKDGPETIKAAREFKNSVLQLEIGWNAWQWMFVPQGRDLVDFLKCVAWAAKEEWITTLGISRHMLETLNDLEARIDFVKWISDQYEDRFQLHMLGGSHLWSMELKTAASEVGHLVRGFDSSMPFYYAYYSRDITDLNAMCTRPEGYFEAHASSFDQTMLDRNIAYLKEWAGPT